MTDYEKHIGSLNAARNGLHPDSHLLKALTAAIELMQAAAPKDAGAERKYIRDALVSLFGDGCDEPDAAEIRWALDLRVAARADGYNAGKHAAIALMQTATPKDAEAERAHCYKAEMYANSADCEAALRVCFERERAAARAEGYAAGKHAADEGLQADTSTVLELAEAKSELFALRGKETDLTVELDIKRCELAAARAEIERLRTEAEIASRDTLSALKTSRELNSELRTVEASLWKRIELALGILSTPTGYDTRIMNAKKALRGEP